MTDDRRLHHLTEDATGFGRAEFRTLKDSLLRPREQLDAYMVEGSDGGGRYTRPLKLYLALSGVMMLMLFLAGGTEVMVASLPAEALAPLAEGAGKSVDAFLADADGWASLAFVPVLVLFNALVSAPLFRWWDRDDLGWSRGFRATFAYRNAVVLPMLPFSWLSFQASTSHYAMALMFVFSVVTFMRMGRGRWFQSTVGGLGKAVCLFLATFVGGAVATFVVVGIGVLGGIYGA